MESNDKKTAMDGETERDGKENGESTCGGVTIGKALRRSMKKMAVEERTVTCGTVTGRVRRIPELKEKGGVFVREEDGRIGKIGFEGLKGRFSEQREQEEVRGGKRWEVNWRSERKGR